LQDGKTAISRREQARRANLAELMTAQEKGQLLDKLPPGFLHPVDAAHGKDKVKIQLPPRNIHAKPQLHPQLMKDHSKPQPPSHLQELLKLGNIGNKGKSRSFNQGEL
jgi:hypothetical protein